MSLRLWLPWVLLLGAGLTAFACHALAKRRSSTADCGDYWTRVIRWTGFGLFPLLCISAMTESIAPEFWLSGRHLDFDRVVGSSWALPLAAVLPFAAWALALMLAFASRRGDREAWLAGSIGDSWTRRWVLIFVPLLALPVLWYGRTRLGLGNDAYPAAAWGAAAVMAISLIGLAFSEGSNEVVPVSEEAGEEQALVPSSLPPWPESLEEMGIHTVELARWEASRTPRTVNRTAQDFAERLKQLGVCTAEPQVIEAVHQLVSSAGEQPGKNPTCLIMAPDHCGQIETIALAASDLAIRLNESTLIVTPGPKSEIVAELRRWLPQTGIAGRETVEAIEILPGCDIPERAGIWVVDAATLSDDLMIRLKTGDPNGTGRTVVSRFGWVVWWDLHCYTGVLAANLWAISRRLRRLMLVQGRMGARTLALVRYAEYGDAQLARFVGALLPHKFPTDSQVYVVRSFPKTVVLHELTGHQDYFEEESHRALPQKCRYPELVVAVESARMNWPTSLTTRGAIAAEDLSEALETPVGPVRLKQALVPDPTQAGAQIRGMASSDALSVLEMIAQGGRAWGPGILHHCAISPPENPYVRYILGRLKDPASRVEASRRLVGSEGHEAIYRRHLLLALDEMEDTSAGLFRAMVGEESVIQRTLEELAKQGKLTQTEVRFLDPAGRRHIEQSYRLRLPRAHDRRPLDVAGERIVEVRDPRAGDDDDGVRLRMDRDRQVILAYPGRVFLADSRRYRISDWDGGPQDWIACSPESLPVSTWRVRDSNISHITAIGTVETSGSAGQLLKQVPVTVRYEEQVNYRLERTFDMTRGTNADRRIRTAPLRVSFETKALLLYFEPAPQESEIRALCLALRHVLPVHLGVEEDALEVVQVDGQTLNAMRVHGDKGSRDADATEVFGLAIVDLYPQGIGLVDAIEEDGVALVLKLLRWSKGWLTSAAEAMKQGVPNPLNSPLAVATGGEQQPAKALSLLTRLIGT